MAIAAGSTLAGFPAIAMFQNSGLGNAVNPLSSLTYIFKIPVLLITTLRGEPGGSHDEPQHELMGSITTQMLELLKIRWEYFPTEEGEVEGAVDRAVRHMRETSLPFAFVMRKDSVAPYKLKTKVVPDDPSQREKPLSFSNSFTPPDSFNRQDTLSTSSSFPWPANSPRLSYIPGTASFSVSATSAGPASFRREAFLKVVQKIAGFIFPVIATTGYTGRELYALDDRPNQFYMVGSMGCASSFGLGIAGANPNLPVLVLDGDGAVLMRMGALSVIGAEKPRNLIHIVLDNGAYESTGNQATVSPGVDLCAIAQACGYAQAVEVSSPDALERILSAAAPAIQAMRTAEEQHQHAAHNVPAELSGPLFIRVPILSGAPENLPRPTVTPPEVAKRFAEFLLQAP